MDRVMLTNAVSTATILGSYYYIGFDGYLITPTQEGMNRLCTVINIQHIPSVMRATEVALPSIVAYETLVLIAAIKCYTIGEKAYSGPQSLLEEAPNWLIEQAAALSISKKASLKDGWMRVIRKRRDLHLIKPYDFSNFAEALKAAKLVTM